jgi:hypothetical protein
MNPAGRVRCNIMPIAIGYSCVSQPFSLRASHALGYRRAVPHSILEAPARPGLSFIPCASAGFAGWLHGRTFALRAASLVRIEQQLTQGDENNDADNRRKEYGREGNG